MSASRIKYERLLEDLRAELRPQRDWGEGRGIFMVVGHFVVGIAAGAWLFSLLYASRAGLAAAFVLALLGGLAHLVNLAHPWRFWRMMARAGSSWISRGFLGLNLFICGAFLYLVPRFLPASPWDTHSAIAATGYGLAAVGMVILMGYMGFVYSASKAIPFWGSPLHPALYVAYALRGGVVALLVVEAFGAYSLATFRELLLLWAGVTAAVIAFFALEVHGALTGGNAAACQSVREFFAGRVAVYFYGGTLLLGLALPAWLAWAGLAGPLSAGAMAVLGLASAIGDFFMKYSTIRAGIHLPVWTRLAPQR